MQNRYDKCPNCMQALGQGEDVCPYCGFDVSGYEEKPNCLRPFTVLQGKYMIGRVIGMGGFGITYIGWDLNLQTYIAIKEYYPESLAQRDAMTTTIVSTLDSKKEIYDKGLKRYVEEARNLSKFYQLQGIVSVKDFFYENGTGYIVMEYINGVDLKHYLKGMGGKLDEATVLALMKPVFESLYEVHKNGLVHRDISPDNIMVDNEGKIKLIDFGSVRGQSAETDKTYTVILKHGYAPPEQYYAKGKQGPWTDIYSLCASMYMMRTGEV
uniref:serine/threonine protein kinase n=1 Tax=Coprococcus sp. TaxID=2049024 RepID=UPI00402907AE